METELRKAGLSAVINIVVPSRYSLVTIAGPCGLPSEWSRVSAIVREIVGEKLGGNTLRSGALSYAMAKATTDIGS